MPYELKQGQEKQEFSTGARRDTQEGKSRPDLIGAEFLLDLGDLIAENPECRIDLLSPLFLHRMGVVAYQGGKHYGDRNWEKGMPLSRLLVSAMRHLLKLMAGQEDEDHAAQCAWNMMAYVHILEGIRNNSLPGELDDRVVKKNPKADLTPPEKRPTMGSVARFNPGDLL